MLPPFSLSPGAYSKDPLQLVVSSEEELQPAAVLAHLAHLADGAHGALVLAVVLGPVEGALLVRRAAVDGRVASRADLELSELVELDLNLVVRVSLCKRLGLLGLYIFSLAQVSEIQQAYIVYDLRSQGSCRLLHWPGCG